MSIAVTRPEPVSIVRSPSTPRASEAPAAMYTDTDLPGGTMI